MRFIPVLALVLTIGACDLVDTSEKPKAVDAATLAPMTSREQALIFGADGAMQHGNYDTAERDYLTAVAASTGHVDAHIALARLYDKQGQAEKEKVILQKALELQPNHPLANYMIGKLYLSEYKNQEALAAFQRGRQSKPDDIDLNIGEAVTQDMLGQHRDAQRVYGRVLRLNPQGNLINLKTNLAMSYLLSGEPKQAVELLKDEVKKPGVPSVTRHNLAVAYGMLGRHTDAKALLNGEIDEETRQLTLARMKEYLAEKDNDVTTPPLQPTITPAENTGLVVEPGDLASVPSKPVKKEVKPVAKPKAAPKVEKPAEPVAVKAEKPAEEKKAE